MTLKNVFKILSLIIFFTACESKPKVIESVGSASPPSASGTSGKSNMPDVSPVPSSNMHKVVVKETLDTEKYTYMNVTEGDEEFWVAVTKRPIEIGATYYFKGGLLKKNFFSKEYERVFETLYLVGDLRQQASAAGGGSGSAVDQALGQLQEGLSKVPANITPAEGAIKLSELFSNKKKYEGQTVTVTGKIVKVNPMIMNRNWAHLQDGSGKELDLTITSADNIPLGHVVTVEGTIALDKDFGAGYRYDIIMEEAVLK